MYEKPSLQRFGTFRDLTQAGCEGALDGRVVEGVRASQGNATFDSCLVTSR